MFAKKIRAQALVILDEGFTKGMAHRNSSGETWAPRKYVVEVRPTDESPFRAEAEALVWMSWPQKGDIVSVEYNPKNHKTEMIITGDSRYDPKPSRTGAKERMEAERRAALEGTSSSSDEAAHGPGTGQPGYDSELAELEAIEELERREEGPGAPGVIDEHR